MASATLADPKQTHQPLALEEAFIEHYPALLRQVQRFMHDPDDSYDLALTAWEKAQRAWERRPVMAVEVKPWLFRIARNACVDEMRRRQLVRWEPLERPQSGDSDDGRSSHAEHLRSDNYDPEREALRTESMALVRSALEQLPARYRTCLLLRESDGLSCEEIGEQLGLSSGAVRTTLCRARQRLRQEYLALGGEPLAA
jgi:RNA polymerase sigma-70 factor (ECF subfamily)